MQARFPDSKFEYTIAVSSPAGEPCRKRKLREDWLMRVTVVWNIMQTGYCFEDLTKPIVNVDCFTGSFKDLEYRLFKVIEDQNIGIVDEMLTFLGRSILEGVPFEEVDEMVNRIRHVVDEAYRTGRQTEKLQVIVNFKNEMALSLDEYEQVVLHGNDSGS